MQSVGVVGRPAEIRARKLTAAKLEVISPSYGLLDHQYQLMYHDVENI